MMVASTVRYQAFGVRTCTRTLRYNRRTAAAAASTQAVETKKVALVTGGSGGIGASTVRNLAEKNYTVVIAARSKTKATSAADQVRESVPDADVRIADLDLASFASVRACADNILDEYERLDVVCNNAGIMALPSRELSVDGCEMQMQVNHLGHFVLMEKLYPLLKATADASGEPARIVNVSSVAHNFASTSFPVTDVNLAEPGAYGALGWTAYGNSKLANILFTKELHRRLRKAGVSNVLVNAVHPGVVDSELPRNLSINFYPLLRILGQLITNDEGARGQTRLCLGSAPFETVSGAYIAEMASQGKKGEHELFDSSAQSNDLGLQRAFWDESCRLTGSKWGVLEASTQTEQQLSEMNV